MITITIDGKRVTLEEDWNVKKLFLTVAELKGADINSFYLHYCGKPIDIQRDGSKLVREYHFQNMDSLNYSQKMHGGSRLEPLDGHVTLTKEPCCVTYDENPNEWRAKLACAHSVAVEAVGMMCESTLSDGGYEFRCPQCKHELEFFVIRHILSSVKSQTELRRDFDRVNANFVNRRQREMRRCPTCETYGERDFSRLRGNVNKVVCDTCTRKTGRETPFCWICTQTWKGSGKGCGNSNCKGAEGDLETLRKCGTKTIGSVEGCPDTRACPKCGLLISHIDACKHMTCKCGCNFCFVCLKTPDANGKWQCGSYTAVCPIAARQNTIPY